MSGRKAPHFAMDWWHLGYILVAIWSPVFYFSSLYVLFPVDHCHFKSWVHRCFLVGKDDDVIGQ